RNAKTVAEHQRKLARRRAISAVKGDSPIDFIRGVDGRLGAMVDTMSKATEQLPDTLDVKEIERLRKAGFEARKAFEKQIDDMIEAYALMGGSKEDRRFYETKIAELTAVRTAVGARFGTPLA